MLWENADIRCMVSVERMGADRVLEFRAVANKPYVPAREVLAAIGGYDTGAYSLLVSIPYLLQTYFVPPDGSLRFNDQEEEQKISVSVVYRGFGYGPRKDKDEDIPDMWRKAVDMGMVDRVPLPPADRPNWLKTGMEREIEHTVARGYKVEPLTCKKIYPDEPKYKYLDPLGY